VAWITPIYDRTLHDVQYAQANRHSAIANKGARNHTDLNRITGNIEYLRNMLIAGGINVPAQQSKLIWANMAIEPESDIDKIRIDLNALKAAFPAVNVMTPPTPALPYTRYDKMNDIEKITFDIKYLYELMQEEKIFTGEIYTGESDWN